MEHSIDSYYLLIVKFEALHATESVKHHIYFIDMFDWLGVKDDESVITYDDGPGQMMLKAKRFFELMSKNFIPEPITIQEKAQILIDMLEDGFKRLYNNRLRAHHNLKTMFDVFKNETIPFSINKEKQEKEFNIR